ncbi:MAG: enoyl-CoA hydratase/isomerase family protein [Alphaproteobacteria bacterium]
MITNMSIILQNKKNGVLTLTLNRPEKLNILSDEMMVELDRIIKQADGDDEIKLLVLKGAGRGFCAGADIAEMANKSAKDLRHEKFITKNWESLAGFSKITIVSLHGFALGGGLELAMMADIIFATPDAKLALPEINLGVMPGAGGIQRLLRFMPSSLAHYYILTGEIFLASDAVNWGLVIENTTSDGRAGIVEKTTEKIASASLASLKSIKSSLRDAWELPLAKAIINERQRFYDLFDTDEQKMAMKNFLLKK